MARLKETDGQIFIPANLWSFYTGVWTDTRIAAGNYVMRRTAADAAGQAVVYLGAYIMQKVGTDIQLSPLGVARHRIRGVEIKSIDVIYGIATAALDAHAYDVHEVTFVNNVAAAVVSTVGGTLSGTLAIATQANPYVSRITFGTALVLGSNVAGRDVRLEISWDAAATSVLDYYGCLVNVNYDYD